MLSSLRIFLVAALALACSSANGASRPAADPPGAPIPKPKRIALTSVGVRGDTVLFTARSSKPQPATALEWCTRAVAGQPSGWTGISCGILTAGDTLRVVAVSTTWDSVQFRVTAWARRGAERSRDSVFANTPMFRRALPGPGPIVIDTNAITAIIVEPSSSRLASWGGVSIDTSGTAARSPIQFCAFFRFGDGALAMRTIDKAKIGCGFYYTQRLIAFKKPSAAQQSIANSICFVGDDGAEPGCSSSLNDADAARVREQLSRARILE